MPAKTINMHGKIYDLVDEKIRTKEQALKFADEIRTQGKVAFLNPQKKKGIAINYFIYQAEKSVRVSRKKSVAIETIVSELSKGKESYLKWSHELSKSFLEAKKEANKIPEKEVPKKTTTTKAKRLNLQNSKKTVSKKTKNNKKK